MKFSGNRPLQLFAAVCSVLLLVIITFRLLAIFNPPPPPLVQQTNAVVVKNDSPPQNFPKPRVPQVSESTPTDRPSTTLGTNLPPEMRKLLHSRAIVGFMYSPARDTPECRKILEILLANGHTIDDLDQVYNMLDMTARGDPDRVPSSGRVNGKPYDPNAPTHQRFSKNFRESQEFMTRSYFERGGCPTDIIDSLIAIRPRVFWGNGGPPSNAPQNLTDEDLKKFLAENPVTQ